MPHNRLYCQLLVYVCCMFNGAVLSEWSYLWLLCPSWVVHGLVYGLDVGAKWLWMFTSRSITCYLYILHDCATHQQYNMCQIWQWKCHFPFVTTRVLWFHMDSRHWLVIKLFRYLTLGLSYNNSVFPLDNNVIRHAHQCGGLTSTRLQINN